MDKKTKQLKATQNTHTSMNSILCRTVFCVEQKYLHNQNSPKRGRQVKVASVTQSRILCRCHVLYGPGPLPTWRVQLVIDYSSRYKGLLWCTAANHFHTAEKTGHRETCWNVIPKHELRCELLLDFSKIRPPQQTASIFNAHLRFV